MRLTILAALAAFAAGCDRVPRNAVESCVSDVRMAPARTDILLVVDDSFSMEEEQDNLRRNLAAFVEALSSSAIPHDFQIGVTTTSVHNTHGMDDQYPYWLSPYDGAIIPFPQGRLVAVDPRALADASLRGLLRYDEDAGAFVGTRIVPFGSPTLVDDVETNVLVGIHGSDKEEPLRAAELALTVHVDDGTNAGFLRDGARLGIIILTDEDDCSEVGPDFLATDNAGCHDPALKPQLESLAGFAAFLEAPIAGRQRDPVVAIISGFDPETLEPTGCDTSYDDPTRLAELLADLGPERSFRGSICDASFGPSLQRIADMLVPQTVPLEGAPPDPRMLVVSVRRGGETIACPVAPAGDAGEAEAGAIYRPPQEGRSATVTFQGACRLQAGDQVGLAVICAG